MNDKYVETGRIINTHGVRGDMKIEPWANSPESLLNYKSFFINGIEYPVKVCRIHGKFVIASLEGITDMESAEQLKNAIIYVRREDIPLDDGEYLIGDLIGLSAIDEATGSQIGEIVDILSPPGGDVCVIKGEREILVPLNDVFVKLVDTNCGRVYFHLIEGM